MCANCAPIRMEIQDRDRNAKMQAWFDARRKEREILDRIVNEMETNSNWTEIAKAEITEWTKI